MTTFTDDIDLASERLGGAALACNDEFFAPMANLVRVAEPVWKPDEYTDRGKWMDGWETRRRREPGHDWCVVRLGLPGAVTGVVVDTAHFTGNYPESCSVEGCRAPDGAWQQATWRELVPRSALAGGSRNPFPVDAGEPVTHVRLNIFPDGGVARLRVHGVVAVDWERVLAPGNDPCLDLAALEHGGAVVACSDHYFSSRHNLILPGPSLGMFDGWETKRRRGPGHDWVIVRLGRRGALERAVVDTSHFKGNAPGWCSLDACDGDPASAPWTELLPRTALSPHEVHELALAPATPATHARLNIFPDGGVARLRLYGRCA